MTYTFGHRLRDFLSRPHRHTVPAHNLLIHNRVQNHLSFSITRIGPSPCTVTVAVARTFTIHASFVAAFIAHEVTVPSFADVALPIVIVEAILVKGLLQ